MPGKGWPLREHESHLHVVLLEWTTGVGYHLHRRSKAGWSAIEGTDPPRGSSVRSAQVKGRRCAR
eukprot:scaffold154608_cov32-Tisochrysis_lutea.AAC.1